MLGHLIAKWPFVLWQEKGETALHLAVLLADRTSLHVADFLFHNWSVRNNSIVIMKAYWISACKWSSSYLPFHLVFSFSNNLDVQTMKGNTALHYCCQHNKTECLKLLLRAKANTHISEWDPKNPKTSKASILILVYAVMGESILTLKLV